MVRLNGSMSDAAEALDISTEETELSRTSIGDLLTAVDSELDKAAAFLTKTKSCYSRGDTFNREPLSVLACPASSKHSPSKQSLRANAGGQLPSLTPRSMECGNRIQNNATTSGSCSESETDIVLQSTNIESGFSIIGTRHLPDSNQSRVENQIRNTNSNPMPELHSTHLSHRTGCPEVENEGNWSRHPHNVELEDMINSLAAGEARESEQHDRKIAQESDDNFHAAVEPAITCPAVSELKVGDLTAGPRTDQEVKLLRKKGSRQRSSEMCPTLRKHSSSDSVHASRPSGGRMREESQQIQGTDALAQHWSDLQAVPLQQNHQKRVRQTSRIKVLRWLHNGGQNKWAAADEPAGRVIATQGSKCTPDSHKHQLCANLSIPEAAGLPFHHVLPVESSPRLLQSANLLSHEGRHMSNPDGYVLSLHQGPTEQIYNTCPARFNCSPPIQVQKHSLLVRVCDPTEVGTRRRKGFVLRLLRPGRRHTPCHAQLSYQARRHQENLNEQNKEVWQGWKAMEHPDKSGRVRATQVAAPTGLQIGNTHTAYFEGNDSRGSSGLFMANPDQKEQSFHALKQQPFMQQGFNVARIYPPAVAMTSNGSQPTGQRLNASSAGMDIWGAYLASRDLASIQNARIEPGLDSSGQLLAISSRIKQMQGEIVTFLASSHGAKPHPEANPTATAHSTTEMQAASKQSQATDPQYPHAAANDCATRLPGDNDVFDENLIMSIKMGTDYQALERTATATVAVGKRVRGNSTGGACNRPASVPSAGIGDATRKEAVDKLKNLRASRAGRRVSYNSSFPVQRISSRTKDSGT